MAITSQKIDQPIRTNYETSYLYPNLVALIIDGSIDIPERAGHDLDALLARLLGADVISNRRIVYDKLRPIDPDDNYSWIASFRTRGLPEREELLGMVRAASWSISIQTFAPSRNVQDFAALLLRIGIWDWFDSLGVGKISGGIIPVSFRAVHPDGKGIISYTEESREYAASAVRAICRFLIAMVKEGYILNRNGEFEPCSF